MQRIRVIFHGRVQGVGFRATARDCARGLSVVGWVRNLEDGSVELQSQAEPDQNRELLRRIRERMAGNITREDQESIGVLHAETGFEIRR